MIFDPIRNTFVPKTPEEVVRQWMIEQLLEQGYSKSKLQIEFTFKVGQMTKRADIVIFDEYYQPKIIIECKAPHILLSQNVLNQASVYNLHLKAPYLVITNGVATLIYAINFQEQTIYSLEKLPEP